MIRMADTTIGVADSTVERLTEQRSEAYLSHDEYINGVLDVVPSMAEIQEGCVRCGEKPFRDSRIEESSGVIRWFYREYEDHEILVSNYYCSPRCAAQDEEEAKEYIPTHPDKVIVGGKDELRTEVDGAKFILTADAFEVGIDTPGAFAGSDSHGNEYDYIGEPVYIKNKGKIVQQGLIEEIIHEDTHTALLLKHSTETQEYHPGN